MADVSNGNGSRALTFTAVKPVLETLAIAAAAAYVIFGLSPSVSSHVEESIVQLVSKMNDRLDQHILTAASRDDRQDEVLEKHERRLNRHELFIGSLRETK